MKHPIASAIIIAALPGIHYSAIAQDGVDLATQLSDIAQGSSLSSA